MASHVLFDFFGTLVEYSPSRTDQGYDRSFSLLRSAGFRRGYEEFLSLWSRVSSEFDRAAESSHREFSMDELVESFLERALGSAPAGLTTRFVDTYLEECSSRCSSSSRASRSSPVEATHQSGNRVCRHGTRSRTSTLLLPASRFSDSALGNPAAGGFHADPIAPLNDLTRAHRPRRLGRNDPGVRAARCCERCACHLQF